MRVQFRQIQNADLKEVARFSAYCYGTTIDHCDQEIKDGHIKETISITFYFYGEIFVIKLRKDSSDNFISADVLHNNTYLLTDGEVVVLKHGSDGIEIYNTEGISCLYMHLMPKIILGNKYIDFYKRIPQTLADDYFKRVLYAIYENGYTVKRLAYERPYNTEDERRITPILFEFEKSKEERYTLYIEKIVSVFGDVSLKATLDSGIPEFDVSVVDNHLMLTSQASELAYFVEELFKDYGARPHLSVKSGYHDPEQTNKKCEIIFN